MTRQHRGLAAAAILSVAVGWCGPQGALAQPAQWKMTKTVSDHKSGVNSLAISPDGKLLASASLDKTVGLWDVAAGKRVTFLRGHKGRVFCVTFSPDGKTVASGGENLIVTWDAGKHEERGDRYEFPNPGDNPEPNILSLAYSPDGDRLMAHAFALRESQRAGYIYDIYSGCQMWDTKSGEMVYQYPRGRNFSSKMQAALSPDGKRLLLWQDAQMALLDPNDAEAPAKQTIETEGAAGSLEPVPLGARVGFSPEGWAFSISNPHYSLILWKYRRLKLERAAPPWRPANVSKVSTAAFSPDGKTLAVGMVDKGSKEPFHLKLFEYGEGRLRELQDLGTEHPDTITAIAFAPDGKTMATGCQGGFIKLWVAGK